MLRALPALFAGLLFATGPQAGGGVAQESTSRSGASTVVKPHAYVSLDPVPRRSLFELAVVAEIAPGYHINANKVLDPYLIPTEIKPQFSAEFHVLETLYPPGQLEQFPFADHKLAVYDGRVTLRMRVEASADAPLGNQRLSLVLHYQACNSNACLRPTNIPIEMSVKVAPAGAKAHAVHPEIFGSKTDAPTRKPS